MTAKRSSVVAAVGEKWKLIVYVCWEVLLRFEMSDERMGVTFFSPQSVCLRTCAGLRLLEKVRTRFDSREARVGDDGLIFQERVLELLYRAGSASQTWLELLDSENFRNFLFFILFFFSFLINTTCLLSSIHPTNHFCISIQSHPHPYPTLYLRNRIAVFL